MRDEARAGVGFRGVSLCATRASEQRGGETVLSAGRRAVPCTPWDVERVAAENDLIRNDRLRAVDAPAPERAPTRHSGVVAAREAGKSSRLDQRQLLLPAALLRLICYQLAVVASPSLLPTQERTRRRSDGEDQREVTGRIGA